MPTVAELNECQRAYTEARKQAIALTKRIQRALLEWPVAANGDWSVVGSMQHFRDELQGIADELHG